MPYWGSWQESTGFPSTASRGNYRRNSIHSFRNLTGVQRIRVRTAAPARLPTKTGQIIGQIYVATFKNFDFMGTFEAGLRLTAVVFGTQNACGVLPLSPCEERAGREPERGETDKKRLLSPALSSFFEEERERKCASALITNPLPNTTAHRVRAPVAGNKMRPCRSLGNASGFKRVSA